MCITCDGIFFWILPNEIWLSELAALLMSVDLGLISAEDKGSSHRPSSTSNGSTKFWVVVELICFLGSLFLSFFFFPVVAIGKEDLVRVSAECCPFDKDFLQLTDRGKDPRTSATAMECWHILNAW